MVDQVERMAVMGWSLGRRSRLFPGLRFRPVPPLGFVYDVYDGELHVVHVLDGRRQRQLP